VTGRPARTWELMTSLSSAGFTVRNFGVRTVHGQVPIAGAWVDVDRSQRPVAASAVLDLAGLSTGNARRDRDLRRPHLLDTERYPVLTFTSHAIEWGESGGQLHGTLSAHGHDVDVVLATEAHEHNGQQVVHATTSFDRRDLGIHAPRLLIGPRIDVDLRLVFHPAEARRPVSGYAESGTGATTART
jgi:polyisoprenoid-binding protein YceI